MGTAGFVGWDIGGVNVKASWLAEEGNRIRRSRVVSRPFEIWRDRELLPEVLRAAAGEIARGGPVRAMAVTMSAELSDVFAIKREGVLFVLECVRSCFPGHEIHVLSLSGELVRLETALASPMEFAAANWAASARWLAGRHPNSLLVDVGSTTTDILPVLDGRVLVGGKTDMERLVLGELVYTGALRTNVAAIVRSVPVRGRACRVASEYFTVSGDVNLILGYLDPDDYTCTTPDNRPPTAASARGRLARLVCADTEMLAAQEIEELARYVHAQQVLQIRSAMEQVVARLPELRRHPAVVFGTGAFLGEEAAAGLGLEIRNLRSDLGEKRSDALPCLAVACLLAEQCNAGHGCA
ncbi:MAG: H4MPT-linked C1 transfer pathway protein [Acidobacteria bacterium]|nr:H4MPT-linked C1 transfer pathway protein [Acidobacteriota bacterium]